jgi:hypothetical protein
MDGKTLVVGYDNGAIVLWDIEDLANVKSTKILQANQKSIKK